MVMTPDLRVQSPPRRVTVTSDSLSSIFWGGNKLAQKSSTVDVPKSKCTWVAGSGLEMALIH